MLGLVKHWAPL